MRVFVTGATGFVGSAVVHELRKRGIETRALVRGTRRAGHLERLGAEVAYGDVTAPDSVLAAVRGCTHVIHLVAIIRGRHSDFDRVMVGGTRNMLAAARAAGVRRFVQSSALGVDRHTRTLTPYFAAKWQMECDVGQSGLEHAIIRPSFVFGRTGGVLPTFVRQVRYSPVVPIIGSGAPRFQPVWIDDVAEAFIGALDSPAMSEGAFDLGGPDQVSWDELYARLAKTMGKTRLFVHIPARVARTGALLTEWIPGSPLSADQVTMLEDSGDNVVRERDAAATLGLPLVPLDEQLRRAI